MDTMPQTTLTQKRNQISSVSSGAKKLTREQLDHTPTSSTPEDDQPSRGAIVRVLIWIFVVVFIGVGAALLITSLNSNNNRNDQAQTENETPESFPTTPTPTPVAEEEPEEELEEPGEELPEEETPAPTPVPPTTPVATSLDEYSMENRSLKPANVQNNLILNNFKFFSQGDEFNYIFYNITTSAGSIDPAIDATYEGNNLVIALNNISRDNVTGKNAKTSRSISGVPNLTGTETENTGSVSKYKFLLTKKLDYKVLVDAEKREIQIKLKVR